MCIKIYCPLITLLPLLSLAIRGKQCIEESYYGSFLLETRDQRTTEFLVNQ